MREHGGGHGQHRHPVEGVIGPDPARRLESVHPLHLHVHQDDVKPLRSQQRQRGVAAPRHRRAHPQALEHVARNQLVVSRVFHHQRARAAQRTRTVRQIAQWIGDRCWRPRGGDAVEYLEQARRSDRLAQHRAHREIADFVQEVLPLDRIHHDGHRGGRPRIGGGARLNPARDLERVHLWHVPVHQDEIEWPAPRVGRCGEHLLRSPPRLDFADGQPPAAEQGGEPLSGERVLVHNQHALPAQQRVITSCLRRRGHRQRQFKTERAADAG